MENKESQFDCPDVDIEPRVRRKGTQNTEQPAVRWLQIITLTSVILAAVGQFFVYKDRIDRTDRDMSDLQADRKIKIAEYQLRMEAVETFEATMKDFIVEQRRLNDQFVLHIADKTIHVTKEDMQSYTMAQLQPVTVSLGRLEVQVEGQQKQLDRMENMLNTVVDTIQKDKLAPVAK